MSRRRKNLLLVLACTLLGAGAQVLFKMAGLALGPSPSPLQMVLCPPLIAGYVLYGVSTVLLSFALRNDELSSMYPIISLTYVWVMFLSVWYFHETLNFFKVLGVAVIMSGVAVLGLPDGWRKPKDGV
ncbi:MAG: EamA family transporter [Bryobacteraceae bacterium]|nr:EamA family transporter [Bryobacteraceae bacterium]